MGKAYLGTTLMKFQSMKEMYKIPKIYRDKTTSWLLTKK